MTIWISYYLLVLVTTHYMATYISGVFVSLAVYQAISAGIRMYWMRKTSYFRYLAIYFGGVILVVLLYVVLIFIYRSAFVFTLAIV
ncbi:MAG: hypothetical protein KGO92_08975, partial [Bacteroidota bacterium]|nr:hypothetical protein [Bacteroidota bacterium]